MKIKVVKVNKIEFSARKYMEMRFPLGQNFQWENR